LIILFAWVYDVGIIERVWKRKRAQRRSKNQISWVKRKRDVEEKNSAEFMIVTTVGIGATPQVHANAKPTQNPKNMRGIALVVVFAVLPAESAVPERTQQCMHRQSYSHR